MFARKILCTPPNANGIVFDSLYDELSHRLCIFETNNPDPVTKFLHCVSVDVKMNNLFVL